MQKTQDDFHKHPYHLQDLKMLRWLEHELHHADHKEAEGSQVLERSCLKKQGLKLPQILDSLNSARDWRINYLDQTSHIKHFIILKWRMWWGEKKHVAISQEIRNVSDCSVKVYPDLESLVVSPNTCQDLGDQGELFMLFQGWHFRNMKSWRGLTHHYSISKNQHHSVLLLHWPSGLCIYSPIKTK